MRRRFLLVALAASLGLSTAIALRMHRPAPPRDPSGLPAERVGTPILAVTPLPSSMPATPASAPRPLGSGAVRPGAPAMQHLDAHRTNRSPFVAPRQPRLLWDFPLGEAIATPPVVHSEVAIVATLGGRLTAIGLDGRQRWSIELEKRIYGSPLLSGATVLVGLDDKVFVAVDASTGRTRWKLAVAGDADTAVAPTPDGGAVFTAGPVAYGVRADGTVRWRYQHRRRLYGAAAVGDDGAAYLSAQDGSVLALAADGSLRWRTVLGRDADAGLAIGDDGTVYAGTDGDEVVALGASDGAVRWRADVGGYVRGPLSVGRDGAVLASTYGPAPAVLALDGASGRVLWRFGVRGTGAREFGIHGSPIEDAEGTLLFGAQDDTLYALEPSGQLRWKQRFGGDIDATVVLAADRLVLVGSGDGHLCALGDSSP